MPANVQHSCRWCGGDLFSVLDLGALALSDFPLPGGAEPVRVPLDLSQCERCKLVQLRHTVEPDEMFRRYWYRSGINETMRAELQDVVTRARDLVLLNDGDTVVDIGANDGTLLSYFPPGVQRVAFEPALNLQEPLRQHATQVIADYFPHAAFRLDPAKLIFSIACFYDVDVPDRFVQAIAGLLHPEGAWIVQFQDLHQMIAATAFDNICHEHLIYYSLASFERLILPYGLRIVDAQVRPINGGSLRLTVMHKEEASHPRHALTLREVEKVRRWEEGCEHWETLERFAWRVGEARRQIQSVLHVTGRMSIDLYGASTKGNTLLQYCGIGPELVRQAWERSPEKVGRETITGIPIVSEADGRHDPPELLFCGIWQFRDSMLKREASYLATGGTILFPLPSVDLVNGVRS